MFSLRTIRGHQLLEEVTQGDMSTADTFLSDLPRDDIYVSEEEEEEEDASLDSDLDPEELAGVRGPPGLKEQKRVQFAEVEDDKEEEGENPLLVSLEEKTVLQEEQANLWFSKDGFSGIEDDADEALEIGQAQLLNESRRKAQQQPAPPPAPSSLKSQRQSRCREEASEVRTAPLETDAAPGPGGEMTAQTVTAVAVRMKGVGNHPVVRSDAGGRSQMMLGSRWCLSRTQRNVGYWTLKAWL